MDLTTRHPSPEAIATYSDGELTEFFIATVEPKKQGLITVEFFERRPDLGEIDRLKQVPWDVPVPEDVTLFVAGSGLLRDDLGTMWTGWRDDQALYALSLFQEQPVRVAIQDPKQLIQPAITVASKKMHQYWYQPEGDSWQLLRHELSGEFGQSGSVRTVTLGQYEGQPAIVGAAPVPDAKQDQVVVAWVGRQAAHSRVGIARIQGDSVETVYSQPLENRVPIEGQPPGIHVDAELGVTVGFVAESVLTGVYSFVEAVCDAGAETCSTQTQSLDIYPKGLHAARIFYYKSRSETDRFLCMLKQEGLLVVSNLHRERVMRQHVDPSYGFPIVTSAGARYEAAFTEEGEVTFREFG